MAARRRELLIWVGSTLAIVALALGWLWYSAPPENLLPQQYGYGVL